MVWEFDDVGAPSGILGRIEAFEESLFANVESLVGSNPAIASLALAGGTGGVLGLGAGGDPLTIASMLGDAVSGTGEGGSSEGSEGEDGE